MTAASGRGAKSCQLKGSLEQRRPKKTPHDIYPSRFICRLLRKKTVRASKLSHIPALSLDLVPAVHACDCVCTIPWYVHAVHNNTPTASLLTNNLPPHCLKKPYQKACCLVLFCLLPFLPREFAVNESLTRWGSVSSDGGEMPL